ncbi:hypothetical protein Tco_0129216 [Tanacetum coccineum]
MLFGVHGLVAVVGIECILVSCMVRSVVVCNGCLTGFDAVECLDLGCGMCPWVMGCWGGWVGEGSQIDLLRSEFGISSWRGSRVDGRSCLLSGAIDGSEGNRIIRDSKQEVWNDCKSCKVRVGSNGNLLWEASVLLGRKVHEDDVAKTVFRMRNGHVEVYGYAFWVNQCTSGFHGVNEPGGVRVAREDDRGVSEGREDVREVFQQRGSRAKRKLSRCGRNQMGNEPILALPEGADDFVVYYDARSKDLEACLEKGRSEFDFEAKYHLGKANVDVVPWNRKKE